MWLLKYVLFIFLGFLLADFGVGAQITSTMGKRNSFIGTPYWFVDISLEIISKLLFE